MRLKLPGKVTLMHLIIPLLFFCNISANAAAPPAPAPRTGQTDCYDPIEPSVITCAGTGQDGDTLTGVAWPKPRFADNGDQTATDKLTGLVWTGDADPAGGYKTWQQALDYIKTLNSRKHLGHDDWRLPNIIELESLVNKQPNLATWLNSQGFSNVRMDYYWTSTTYASYTSHAWSLGMSSGIVAGHSKTDRGYVWPVRKGKGGVLTLPRTGQTICYDNSGTLVGCAGTGQDGELHEGAAWPTPRFTDNADDTMTDRLTGLVWSKEGKTPGPGACGPGMHKTGHGALDYIKCLNASSYLGRNDWRLPNRNELSSLVNHGQSNSAAWLKTLGFSNVQAHSYWSSSTYSYNTWNSWSVNMHDGAVTSTARRHVIDVWPVRSGQ